MEGFGMTIQSIIDGILAYHPDIGDRRTCDVVIGGDPDVECTGVLVSIAPTVDVIRKAMELGANFIFVHEPTFYSGYDDECGWLEGNDLLQRLQLGWLEYVVPGSGFAPEIKLPETTLGELVLHVKKAMGLQTIRYIGNPDAKVSTVGFCGHLLPNENTNWSNNAQVAASWKYDVVIPGETVDWTLPLYIRDAAMLGKAKGMIIPGHFVQEEAGMRWAVEWLRPIVGGTLPVTFVSAGDMFDYM
jgi:putative NIF3 family GTP cyclohydrolase 1 type 2